MKRIGLKRGLAIMGAVLGALALFGNPYRGGIVTLDTSALAHIVEHKQDHVTATELADWILQGQTDFRLIDIRDEASYAAYHIPTAEHVPLSALPEHELYRNEKIALYSDGGIHAAQAWMLLKALDYPGVYTLLGGLDAWKDEVLFPAPPPGADGEALVAFERAKQVALRFGGSPRTEQGAGAEITSEFPDVPPPAETFAPTTRKKKKKKGC